MSKKRYANVWETIEESPAQAEYLLTYVIHGISLSSHANVFAGTRSA